MGLEYLAFASNFLHFSGPNNPILDLGNHLYHDQGIEFSVCTHGGGDPEFERLVSFPVHHSLFGSAKSVRTRMAVSPLNVARIRGLLARTRPAKTIVFSSLDTAFEVAIAAGGRIPLGQNIFFSFPLPGWTYGGGWKPSHPPTAVGSISGLLDRLAARTIVRLVLAHTMAQKRAYLALGIPDAKIVVLPHCIDPRRVLGASDWEPNRSSTDGPVRLLYVGRLEPEKGILFLLRAVAGAARELSLHLDIVGKGSLGDHLSEMVEEMTPPSRFTVTHHEMLCPKELRNLAMQDDIVVMPSPGEPFGVVALEAMCFGKPVIASRFGGIAELVHHEREGLLVDPQDAGAFADTILRLAGDQALRVKLGDNGRRRIQSTYDVRVIAPRFIRFMDQQA